ncbi:lecithin retinol acyltransferase-like, partial [Ruditapes philippinarum]|uniref:lecithin retinol acyltransferase-like n=1 Tax=Ruditapes philippinarum TaxID=129788 RepID=UPI00295B70F7
MDVQHNARLFLNSLEAGDMISFDCKTATHWGIYVGNKKVVHLTGKEEDILNDLSDQNEALFTVADKKYTKAYVKEEDFFVVAETFDTYESNLFDHQEGMIPFDPDEIVQLAKVMKGRIYYDATWNSCMKMAIFCRYVTIYDSNESEDEENDDDDGSVDAINANLSYKRGDKTILIQRRQSATGPQSAK